MAMATNAHASWYTKLKNALRLGDETAQVTRQSDDLAKTGMKNYDKAVEAGEIFPRLLDELDDPFNTPDTKHLFTSLRTRDLVKTVGQIDAISDAGTALRTGSTDGFVLVGEKGSGKTQIINSIEYKFRRAANRNPKAKESYVIKISTDSPDFKDLESFRSALNELEQMDEFVSADTIVFYFDDLAAFKKSEGGAGPIKLETYWDLLRRMNKGGQKIKIAAETDTAGSASVLEGSSLGTRLTKVLVKESNESDEIATIIKYNMSLPAFNATGSFQITDSSIGKLVRWIKRYAPGPGASHKAIKVLDNSMARIRDFLEDDLVELADDITDALKKDLEDMRDRLARAETLVKKGDSPALNAKKQAEELPELIAKLENELIPNSEKEYKRLLEIRKRRFEIQSLKATSSGDEAIKLAKEYDALTKEALTLSDRRMAIELSKVSGVNVSEILKFTGKLTLKQFRKQLDENLIGQEKLKLALMRGAENILDMQSGAKKLRKKKTMFNILMWGPPGTGKTDGYSMLAEFMDDYMVIPGGEYTDGHMVTKLKGSEPGWVGYENGGVLTNQAQTIEGTAYLADEADKAALEFFQFLNGALNPGIVKDGRGIDAHFVKAIFGFAMNSGWEAAKRDGVDPSLLDVKEAIEYIRKTHPYIPPEFFDRMDEIVYVGRANAEETMGILNKFVRITNDSEFLKGLMIKVQLSDSAKKKMVQMVEDVEGSAREVIRQVDRQIERPITQMMKPAAEVVAKPIKSALDQGHYIDDLTGEIRTLKLREGDLVELDWDDSKGFVFRVMD